MPVTNPTKEKSPLLFVIVVLFFLFLVAGIAGLYFAKSFSIPVSLPAKLSGIVGNSAGTPRATENDFAFIADPIVRKHMTVQANQTAFRMKSRDAVSVEGFHQVFDVQIRGEEMAYAMWQDMNGKKSGELISIGDSTFVRDYADNTWWMQTEKTEAKPTGSQEPLPEPSDFKKEYEELKTKPPVFEKLGEESCGLPANSGLRCYKYKEVDSQTPEASRIFWFDTKEYLLRKEESGYGEWRSSVTYEYAGINVTVPRPTKLVPPGKNIYEYLNQGAFGQGTTEQSPSTVIDTSGSRNSDFETQNSPDVVPPEEYPEDSTDAAY